MNGEGCYYKKRGDLKSRLFWDALEDDYIMPPMPPIPSMPPPCECPASGSLISLKTHSVVKIIPPIEAAFSSATRDTFLGSITPAAIKF